MKHARYTYEYLKRRDKIVRDVTRGMAVVTNTNAIAYGMDILGEALAHAVKYGMTDVPKIKSAEILFKNLARGRRARDMLRKIGKHVVMSSAYHIIVIHTPRHLMACPAAGPSRPQDA